MLTGFRDDNYLSCSDYLGHEVNANGFSLFQFSNDQFYIVIIDGDGSVILRSEGYSNDASRVNGMNSVLSNMNDEDRYTTKQLEDGRWVLCLIEKNHQEIARSCPCASESDAKSYLPSERKKQAEARKVMESDDYLICQLYKDQFANVSKEYPDFIKFTHQNGKYYFAMVDGDEVLLRSEGYKSESDRDNGIESVIRNRDIEERYSIVSVHGIFFAILKASNNQEIARSCPQKSNHKAKAIIPKQRATKNIASTPIISKFTVESEKLIISEPPNPERFKVELVIDNVASEEKLTPSIPIPPPVILPKKKEVDDNYLHCKEYHGHPIVDKMNRVAFFRHAGEFYFAIYKEDGSVRLRSEGFASIDSRDKELSIALRHLNTIERYTNIRNGEMYIKILKDIDGREVGRSCLEKDEVKVVHPSAPLSIAEVVGLSNMIAGSNSDRFYKDKDDDYLECKHYMGHAISDKDNKVAFFQHEGQYYFVIYYADGRVRLRSEGFQKTSQRDSELKAALRHLDDKDQYEVIKKSGFRLRILKDKTGREVGRSCLEKEYIAPVAPMSLADPTAGPLESELNKARSVEIVRSEYKWWKWLLPLLLIAILLFLLKYCN